MDWYRGLVFSDVFPRVEVRRHSLATPWTYPMLCHRQDEVARDVRIGRPGAILLSEVAPVITLGRRASESELTLPPEVIRSQGIDVFKTDRGGLATYHGPGQWVLFVVDRLDRLTGDPRGVRKAVDRLLEILMMTARIYEPGARVREGAELGLWGPRGKLGSVGVQIEQGVLLHGLALNGFKTAQSFQGLRPCGLEAPVDYLIPTADDGAFRALGDRLISASQTVFWKG